MRTTYRDISIERFFKSTYSTFFLSPPERNNYRDSRNVIPVCVYEFFLVSRQLVINMNEIHSNNQFPFIRTKKKYLT